MRNYSAKKVDAWLISPEGSWCYRFHRDYDSLNDSKFVYVDEWSAQPDGTPSQMKKRSKLPLEEALELCGQMLLDGWQKLSNQFGEAPEIEFSEEVAA